MSSSSLFTDLKDETMLQEILKECDLAEEYLQAMKKTMLNDKGDCDNVRMHIAKIKGKVNTLLIADVGNNEETVCPNCDGEGFSGKGTTEVLPCLSCFGSGVRAD